MIEYFKDNLFVCVSKYYGFGLVTMEEYLETYNDKNIKENKNMEQNWCGRVHINDIITKT